jgi:hypothetical protein
MGLAPVELFHVLRLDPRWCHLAYGTRTATFLTCVAWFTPEVGGACLTGDDIAVRAVPTAGAAYAADSLAHRSLAAIGMLSTT